MVKHNKVNGRSTSKKILYLACEGGEIGTEGTYIKQLCNVNSVKMITIYKGSADPLTLADCAISFSKGFAVTKKDKPAEIWIVIDNDEPHKVKAAYERIEQYNGSIKRGHLKINIAFNAPCVETFGLLCCKIDNIPEQKKDIYSQLKDPTMPRYFHNKCTKGGPYFDFNTMEQGYDFAVKRAKNWKQSLACAKEYDASPFAGIYKLTESIKN